ncbi:hypothetical protein Mco01_20900 [Microbispora corallina]|uniref:Lipoprotein n=1 Tax=Microbispora corallina TaxID=83302 RepID=A0ABQ4FWC7_9ACTN|nr:hypothetical protein MPTA5024_34200 [Microbispora sp. ATCC PTA-5024]GIH39090.1 hypothetical protein Mco01_20900 [Microbispora corallina]
MALRTFEVLRLSPRTALARVAVVPAAVLLSACAASHAASPDDPSTYGPPPTVEQLAAKAGCTPKIQIDAKELRQGFCRTSIGEFFITTFATQQGKDEWMDQAPEYSPHLVGNIWTALAPRVVLDKLRQEIGGDLHLKDHRTMSPGPR